MDNTYIKSITRRKKMKKQLPKHLIKVIENSNKDYKKLGGDPDFLAKCLKKAEERGDDNALIHGLVG